MVSLNISSFASAAAGGKWFVGISASLLGCLRGAQS